MKTKWAETQTTKNKMKLVAVIPVFTGLSEFAGIS